MKSLMAVIAGMLLVVSAGDVRAADGDCEAERCLIQATIDEKCPCATYKPGQHGRYTACVAKQVNKAAHDGTISRKCRGKINGCFIRSTCGKRDGSVACQLGGVGVSGRCRPLSSAEQCTKRGGAVVETCCETCGGEPGTPTPTSTPGEEATPTFTPTEEATPTFTPPGDATPTFTATAEATPCPTFTPAVEETPTFTPGVEVTATFTPGVEVTATFTPGVEVTATFTPGVEVTATFTPGAGVTATFTPGVEVTATFTPGVEVTATFTPTVEATPTFTATVEETPTSTPGPEETATPTEGVPTPTVTATPPPAGVCLSPGEPVCPNAGNGLEICSLEGTCNCPTRVAFAGDNTAPETILDTGWTGIAHRAPVISNGDVTVSLINCTGEGTTDRPQCPRDCQTTGPIANTDPSQLRNQRCTADTSKQCTNAPGGTGGNCTGFGTCEFFFGAPLPLVAGGVGTCVENIFNGAITGTADLETGEATTSANLTSRVHAAVISTDTPCPVCVGDPTPNDGVQGGTCNGGPRNTLSCDANGSVFERPDFGVTSLDCPPPASTIAVLPIDLTNSTGSVSKAITAGSPNCSGANLPAGSKCACDTCNNINQQPCDANSDCPLSGGNPGICGGRRCIGGTAAGTPCASATTCTGGGSCARPGEPTKPNGCVDDTTDNSINGSLCVDTAPVGDNEGECPEGPPTGTCTVGSGHPQRSCTSDNDCCDDAPSCVTDPATAGECAVSNRLCFLDNGLGGAITGTGQADPPVDDVAHPILAAVFCIGPTSAPAVNIAAGLPGPGRVTIKGTALGLP